MIIYFADRKMNIIDSASTSLPGGLYIKDDKKVDEVEAGVATFEFYLPFTGEDRARAEQMTTPGNYILRHYGDDTDYYTIIDSECNTETGEIYVYAEDAGLDLLNEVVGKFEADQAYPISYYVEKFAYDSGFEIGLNEISNLTRKLSWDGEQTVTERLLSVATQFDNAELSFSFETRGLAVTHKYINIHKRRGKDIGVELRMNRDINSIITKKSVANLATALEVTGGTPENAEEPITLNGYSYDDGDFYIKGTRLYSRKAVQKWSRYLSESGDGDGHIVQTYSYDTTSQSELCNRAISRLKSICDIQVNYEVDLAILPENAKIGDTVNIVDAAGNLYLSARLLKLEISAANETQQATLGEYLIKESGIADELKELADQFKNLAQNRKFYTWIAYADDAEGNGISLDPEGKEYLGTAVNQMTETVDISDPSIFVWARIKGDDGESPLLLYISSGNGNIFKNGKIGTVLSAVVMRGSEEVTDEFNDNQFIWSRVSADTAGDETWNASNFGGKKEITITSDDVHGRATFFCDLIDTTTRMSLLRKGE